MRVYIRNAKMGRFAKRDARRNQMVQVFDDEKNLLAESLGRFSQKEIDAIIAGAQKPLPKAEPSEDLEERFIYEAYEEKFGRAEAKRIAGTSLFKVTFWIFGKKYENVVTLENHHIHVVSRTASPEAIAEAVEEETEEEETSSQVPVEVHRRAKKSPRRKSKSTRHRASDRKRGRS